MNINTDNPLYLEQLQIEAKYKKMGEVAAQDVFTKALTDKGGDITRTPLGQRFISHQFEHIRENMKTYITGQLVPKRGVLPGFNSILKELAALYKDNLEELYSIITMATFSTTFNMTMRSEAYFSNVSYEIASEIYHEAKLKAYTLENPEITQSIHKGVNQRVQVLYRRAYMQARMKHDDFSYPEWTKVDCVQMGASFIQILLASSNYFEIPKTKEVKKIYPAEALLEAWKNNTDALLADSHHVCPTVLPPRDWTSLTNGGYYGELQNRHTLLRLRNKRSIFAKRYIKRFSQLDISSTLTAINALQRTAWKINKKVLTVLQQVVANGGGIAGIPHTEPYPALPKLINPSEAELTAHKEKAVTRYKANTRRKSLALRVQSHIRYAEAFQKYDRIYFPCNMDFRGRIYPIPSFSFQGDDFNKSLLLFTDTEPLVDDTQLKWFYITGANLAGVDKVSFEDRIEWIHKHHEQILGSAKDPIGYTFWADQDSPCQFLAFCIEYQALIEHVEKHGSAKGWTTGLPIAFDGTCSGGMKHTSP